MSLLEVEGVNSYYGESHILFDVSLRVEEGEVVALLGRNGSGKTTTMLTIMGIVAPRAGQIRFAGERIDGKQPYQVAQLGVQLVPDARRIIKTITVEENLKLAAFTAKSPWTLERVYQTFPRLAERKNFMGRSLSGGEQQMLAIARALIRDARVLLLDEPFEGLAPIIVHDLLETTRRLASEGRTILIVEQNVRAALVLARRTYVLDRGHVVMEATPAELEAKPDVMHQYLGV
ncbi:MAG TPA: ABC transporter ATP-binding protein [Candidatus Acidoferrales bacterium]|nr:ABC transporter ATP-binding protein [Candidatus Acidoferrales bacterium]